MNKFVVPNDAKYTHSLSTGEKWYIPANEYKQFYEEYGNLVRFKGVQISEQPMEMHGPIAIKINILDDIDLEDTIIIMVEKLTKLLTKILKDKDEKHNYMCVVVQKRNMKHDVLIHFPHIKCSYQCHYALRNMFLLTNPKCSYDKNTIEYVDIPMYNPISDIMTIFNSRMRENELTFLEWAKLLSIRDHQKLCIEYDATLVMAKQYSKEEIRQFNIIRAEKYENVRNNPALLSKRLSKKRIRTYDIEECKELLNMLSTSRYKDYQSWLTIGFILHYCEKTCKRDIDFQKIWMNWSKDCNWSYTRTYDRIWVMFDEASKYYLSFSTLVYFAQQDNPQMYGQFILKKYIQKQLVNIPLRRKEIGEIKHTDMGLIVQLETKSKCIFTEEEHERDSLYIVINDNKWHVNCHECKYKQLPEKSYFIIPKTVSNCIHTEKKNIPLLAMNNTTALICNIEYDIFEDKTLNTLMYISLNGTEASVANVFYHLHKNKFVYSRKEWFILENNRWFRDSERLITLEAISHLEEYYNQMYAFYNDGVAITDVKHKTRVSNEIKKTSRKLLTIAFQHNVCNILMQLCKCKNFYEKLDNRNNLISFNNGVYDYGKFVFRATCMNDYISKSVKYDYSHEYTKYKNELMLYLNSVFPDMSVQNYVLKHISTCLTDIRNSINCTVFSGSKGSGKSTFCKLIEMVLGDYCITYKSNLLLNKKITTDTSCEVLRKFHNARCAIGSEPDSNSKISSAFYKLLAEEDTITTRSMYEKSITFETTHKLFLKCETIPKFDKEVIGIWRNIVCINFQHKFVKYPEAKYERQIDTELKEKLTLYRQDFMLLLIEKYKDYKKNGNPIPETIRDFARQHMISGDCYKEFLHERTEHAKTNIHLNTLYEDFVVWYKASYSTNNVDTFRIFCKEIRKHHETKNIGINGSSSLPGIRNLKLKQKKQQ